MSNCFVYFTNFFLESLRCSRSCSLGISCQSHSFEKSNFSFDFSLKFLNYFFKISEIDTHDLFDKIGYHDFLQSAYGTEWFCVFCEECCGDLMAAIMGPGVNNATRFNQTRMEFYLHHFPAGTSSQGMIFVLKEKIGIGIDKLMMD